MPSSHHRRNSHFSRRDSLGNGHSIFPKNYISTIVRPNTGVFSSRNFEFVAFQRKLMNKLGYVGIFSSRIFNAGIHPGKNYCLADITILAKFLYWILHVNVVLKAIFLSFIVIDSSVEFLDKIATLDYILCSGLVLIGAWTYMLRYPFYEILQNMWKTMNSVYMKHSCPEKVRLDMESLQKRILATHLVIIYGGCTALMIQYFPAPKYVNFTYSTLEAENWALLMIFGVHEFCFMMMAWNGYAGPSSLLMFQGVALSKTIDQLNETLHLLYKDEMKTERKFIHGQGYKFTIVRNPIHPQKTVTETLFLHICGGAQFVSDVFAATHVLKLPGTGFMDVWFYIWDSMSAGFMLLRVYQFMGLVYNSSDIFLGTLREYFTFQNPRRHELRKIARTLRLVSLKVGPCPVSPESLLTVFDALGNYYVCAALW